ncbi:plasmid mobilization relaxosome protein MobC [uncultured Roseobacter sp.]|uniref:plasmid mobilization protein n=1 Tax=uncultured Roseobacter sp. TaxID=114847 RepID=UPI0026348870|nr:plasmid mobilization relaxosome protein MobC [uncultured Roseobacter sp.]
MARPKIDPAKKRTEGVRVPLSPVELAQLNAKADAGETNVTAFVRAAALGKSVTVQKSTAPDFATRDELRRIGVNLNQIAKAMNAQKTVAPSELSAVCEKLDRLFDQWLNHDSQSRKSRPQF